MAIDAVRPGVEFGYLVVLAEAHSDSHGRRFTCRCLSGVTKTYRGHSLWSGHARSCGCYQKKVIGDMLRTHGGKGTTEYASWSSMLARCRNPQHPHYRHYGARGISVCDAWLRFERFKSDMGSRPDGRSLDRIDNNGPYSPENCRWATVHEQVNNRRNTRLLTAFGKTQTRTQWAREYQIHPHTLEARLRHMSLTQALYVPVRGRTLASIGSVHHG